jgi:2-dehydropantoate 2-reductase
VASLLLVGPGAIGATLAAWLAQDDRHQLGVATRTPFDSIEVNTPSGVIRATPRVITEQRQAQPIDWIVVTTKTYDSDAAAQWFAGATGPQRAWRSSRMASNTCSASRSTSTRGASSP